MAIASATATDAIFGKKLEDAATNLPSWSRKTAPVEPAWTSGWKDPLIRSPPIRYIFTYIARITFFMKWHYRCLSSRDATANTPLLHMNGIFWLFCTSLTKVPLPFFSYSISYLFPCASSSLYLSARTSPLFQYLATCPPCRKHDEHRSVVPPPIHGSMNGAISTLPLPAVHD
jgi:hypothetical protein